MLTTKVDEQPVEEYQEAPEGYHHPGWLPPYAYIPEPRHRLKKVKGWWPIYLIMFALFVLIPLLYFGYISPQLTANDEIPVYPGSTSLPVPSSLTDETSDSPDVTTYDSKAFKSPDSLQKIWQFYASSFYKAGWKEWKMEEDTFKTITDAGGFVSCWGKGYEKKLQSCCCHVFTR